MRLILDTGGPRTSCWSHLGPSKENSPTWACRRPCGRGQRWRSRSGFTPKHIPALDALGYLEEWPPVHAGAPDVNVLAIHYPEWRMQPSPGQGCHINEVNFCTWMPAKKRRVWGRELENILRSCLTAEGSLTVKRLRSRCSSAHYFDLESSVQVLGMVLVLCTRLHLHSLSGMCSIAMQAWRNSLRLFIVLRFHKPGMWQQLTVFCQGLQFSWVSQTAHNLQFNPARHQAEQPLEQQLTLMGRAMFCITVEEQHFQPLKGVKQPQTTRQGRSH